MEITLAQIAGLAVAVLGGAAVGVERQRSGHASGPHARLGGVRTFTLLGAVAGISGLLIGADGLVGDWRLGLLAGYSHSSFDVDDRASSGSSDCRSRPSSSASRC